MIKVATMIISAIIVLQGCSASSVKQQQADVTSNPSGATVYANGQKLGVTPLHYKLFDAFPAGWKDWTYQAQGELVLKMDGCSDYSLKVNDYILSKPVHAELECGGISKTEEETPSMQAEEMAGSGIEARLKELETLYSKGVITKEEYQTNRERILSEI